MKYIFKQHSSTMMNLMSMTYFLIVYLILVRDEI